MKSIGQYAFGHYSYLKHVNFGPEIQSIKNFAFSNCSNLRIVKLPIKDIEIGENAFDKNVEIERSDVLD